MTTLRILSAGAAQAVTERIGEAFRRESGHEVAADFGAVGAMKARVTAGEPVDVIILTRAMIEELVSAGLVEAGSRIDLGTVGTGVAVRAGAPVPDVADERAIREAILAARSIVCPDPAVATAGKIVMGLTDALGVTEQVRGRMQFFPNGYAAMGWLAASGGEDDIGITQITEIVPNGGVTYAGPLPAQFQMKTVYSAGVASRSSERRLAAEFIARFAAPSARRVLAEAGYELDG